MDKKMCSSCERILDIKEFCRDKYSVDGRKSFCKACTRDKFITYYENNRQRLIANKLEWTKKNKERALEHVKRWEKKNPEKVREYGATTRENYRRKWANGELKLPKEAECKECKEVKLMSEFYISQTRRSGHFPYCKECQRARSKKAREDKKPKCLPDISWRTQDNNRYKYWQKYREFQEVQNEQSREQANG